MATTLIQGNHAGIAPTPRQPRRDCPDATATINRKFTGGNHLSNYPDIPVPEWIKEMVDAP
ncbi:MAG: hypothetical protein HC769_10825 [Cyanobacteria bacterium CRU_2_1]|nr:hypothetical protein [Cyanobacteria bacterium CRU_2_1]